MSLNNKQLVLTVYGNDGETILSLKSCDLTLEVMFVNIGEGVSGDFDPDNPDDENLLRVYVALESEDGRLEDSYCTNIPADTPVHELVGKAYYIAEEYLTSNDSFRRIGERMSWLG